MTRKFDIGLVREIVETEGYKLLSTTYINSATKIDLVCPKGHPWSVTLNNFRSQGQRCFTCLEKLVYTTENVRELLSKDGYELITTEYKNMNQRLDLVCPLGHSCSIPLWSFVKTNSRCMICSGIKRYTTEEIADILKKEGYLLISKNYKNAHQKLDAICPNKHAISFTTNDFIYKGSRCRYCAHNSPHNIYSIKEYVEKEGYKLISEIYIPQEKIELICPNNHSYKTTFYNFKGHDNRCPECTGYGSSKAEKEVRDWVGQFFPKTDKLVLRYDPKNYKKYLELDVYVEELKLAIEYNGLHWHCDKYKDKTSHHDKMKLANSLGIRVINIFEDEWLERQNQVKGYIKSVLGKNEIKLFARKTELLKVPKSEAKKFLEDNHIQSSTNFEIALGLYFDNELVAVMTGGLHHRQGHRDVFVLNRLAFKSNVSVAGGSSKLLKGLLAYTKKRGFQKLLSWSDNRISEGRVYESLGFTLKSEHGPDYSYWLEGTQNRISKQSCQKKELIKKGAKGTMANTEKELALTLGLHRIWDCGKKAWAIDLTK